MMATMPMMNGAMGSRGSSGSHPLDQPTRQKEQEAASLLSQFIAGGVRSEDLDELAEKLGPDELRQLLFALQGVPGGQEPSGRDY